jgi:methionine synthase / methylenetetrahydrofolate reductase(NADPH)
VAKVTEIAAAQPDKTTFICDFSPPRGASPELLADAHLLEADFICVAYNPGKAVRVDSAAAASEIKRATGRDVVFNLSPRDMNRLALESHLLGAQLMGLENVLMIQGDPLGERDPSKPVNDYSATALLRAIQQLNEGLDHKGSKLRIPTDFCIGAAIDLGQGVAAQAALVRRKVQAGAQFFVSQPVFNPGEITEFFDAYQQSAGQPLESPVFWGLQILVSDGVMFGGVPEDLRRDLSAGRDGVDIALETYALFSEAEIKHVYLVSPILRGGARDYEAAGRFLDEIRTMASF